MKFKNISDVVAWRLCVGCGACAYICPEQKIKLENIPTEGIRPVLSDENCQNCDDCLQVCPGLSQKISQNGETDFTPQNQLEKSWGRILEIREGYASEHQIRFLGSSGGVVTALALYCLEKRNFSGIMHVGTNSNNPLENTICFSKTKSELLEAGGSRYSPASPCAGLKFIESASSPCVFIGKPCDITAVRKITDKKPQLAEKIGLTIGVFCAGTPATQGTIDLLQQHHIDIRQIQRLKYRGNGWPGDFAVEFGNYRFSLPYREAWSFIQRYRPFRCYLCPDSTSEFADISCGDAWYRRDLNGNPGCSLVIVRNKRGADFLEDAMASGYVKMKKSNATSLIQSQENLLDKRRAIGGRIMIMKLFAIPTPDLSNFYLLNNWMKLDLKNKGKSVLGTMRRIIRRRYIKQQKNTS